MGIRSVLCLAWYVSGIKMHFRETLVVVFAQIHLSRPHNEDKGALKAVLLKSREHRTLLVGRFWNSLVQLSQPKPDFLPSMPALWRCP